MEMMDKEPESCVALFEIGQIVYHKLFDYRGVILDVDPNFQGDDKWYDTVARSCPPKDKPWYHILVDNSDNLTYVAERNLVKSTDLQPINHQLLDHGLMVYEGDRYKIIRRLN